MTARDGPVRVAGRAGRGAQKMCHPGGVARGAQQKCPGRTILASRFHRCHALHSTRLVSTLARHKSRECSNGPRTAQRATACTRGPSTTREGLADAIPALLGRPSQMPYLQRLEGLRRCHTYLAWKGLADAIPASLGRASRMPGPARPCEALRGPFIHTLLGLEGQHTSKESKSPSVFRPYLLTHTHLARAGRARAPSSPGCRRVCGRGGPFPEELRITELASWRADDADTIVPCLHRLSPVSRARAGDTGQSMASSIAAALVRRGRRAGAACAKLSCGPRLDAGLRPRTNPPALHGGPGRAGRRGRGAARAAGNNPSPLAISGDARPERLGARGARRRPGAVPLR